MARLQRPIALVLCLVLIMGLLAGCQGREDMHKDLTVPPESSSVTPPALSANNPLIPMMDKVGSTITEKEFTLMVYMVGSDLESNGGFASNDLTEMLGSGLQATNVNLLVYTGGAKGWALNVPSDKSMVYALDPSGTTLEEVACTESPVNMGDPNTLLGYLEYAVHYYPAREYGLICWDHGGGPLLGFGSDELHGGDSLDMQELELALANSVFAQKKLSFIGFDACLMATLEVAQVLEPYACYLIASEETEPGTGWNYSFLSTLNTSHEPLVVAESILTAYERSMADSNWNPEYTLSCIDLSALPQLMTDLNGVWSLLTSAVDTEGITGIGRSRNSAKRFAMSGVSNPNSSFDLVDLGSLLNHLEPGYGTAIQTAVQSLEKAVIMQVTNLEDVSGLSLYFPYDNKMLYQRFSTQYDYPNRMSSYHTFLSAYTAQWISNKASVQWNKNQSILVKEDNLEIPLGQEMLDHLGSVTYSILERDPKTDAYWIMVSDQSVTPDANGTVVIPKNPDVFLLYTDNDAAFYPEKQAGTLWPVSLLESTATRKRYAALNTVLMPNGEAISSSYEYVQVTFSEDLQTGKLSIQSVQARDHSETAMYGKQDVDISHWGAIGHAWNPRIISYDVNGNMLPCTQWDGNGYFTINYNDFDSTFYFEKTKLQAQEGEFYCQIVIRDPAGNVLGTRLEELSIHTPYREKTVSVDNGKLSFRIYADYAEVTDFAADPYESETFGYGEYHIVVPETVEGVPVTRIGSKAFHSWDIQKIQLPETIEQIGFGAFSGCGNLQEINLPDRIHTIFANAFAWTDLTSVTLPKNLQCLGACSFAGTDMAEITIPASLSYIGNSSFYGCPQLKAIQVDPANTAYKSVDGVLFTADGTRLMAYPEARATVYSIPTGTVEIAPDAFRNNKTLTEVTFPEGLKRIGIGAFSETFALNAIRLPDSLEYIGDDAFGFAVYKTASEVVNHLPTIAIGPNVSWIGTEAFSGYEIGQYQVDRRNRHYSSVDGCLLNASGTQLLSVPSDAAGRLIIPEGVNYIGWSAFESCDGITELVIPDSVVAIGKMSGVPENLTKLTVGKGLMSWPNVHEFFLVKDLQISPQNPNFTVAADGSLYSKDMTVLYLYRGHDRVYQVPEGVITIAGGAFYHEDENTLEVLQLPASLKNLSPASAFSSQKSLTEIQIAEGNASFAAWDGLVYSKDGKILLFCPCGKTGAVTIREGTLEISGDAFGYGLLLDTIVLPEGVVTIHNGNNFGSYNGPILNFYLPASLVNITGETFKYVGPEQVIFHCPAGSKAEEILEASGFTVDNKTP